MCNWLWQFCSQAMKQINFNEFSNFTLCYTSRIVCYLALSNLFWMAKQSNQVQPHCWVCDEVICGAGLILGSFSSDFSSLFNQHRIMMPNVDNWHFQSCVLRISNLVFVIYLSLNSHEGQWIENKSFQFILQCSHHSWNTWWQIFYSLFMSGLVACVI